MPRTAYNTRKITKKNDLYVQCSSNRSTEKGYGKKYLKIFILKFKFFKKCLHFLSILAYPDLSGSTTKKKLFYVSSLRDGVKKLHLQTP